MLQPDVSAQIGVLMATVGAVDALVHLLLLALEARVSVESALPLEPFSADPALELRP